MSIQDTSSVRDPSSASSAKLPRNVKLLGWISLLQDTAGEMVVPLLPQFLIGVLGGTKFHLGIIEGFADSMSSLVKLWSGGWSDRLGNRKTFVVFGYGLPTLVRPLLGLATAPWHAFVIRALDRLGKGVRTPARDALIADSTEPGTRGRAFGFHRAMDHLGAAAGPLLATGFLFLWPGELRLLFMLTVIPGIAVVTLAVFGLREQPIRSEAAAGAVLEPAPFGGRFWAFLGALSVFTLGNSSDTFLLVRASELGVPTVMLPTLWIVFHLVKSAGNILAGRAVDRFGSQRLIVAGWTIYAGVYLLFGLATETWHAWALFLVYGLFYALTEPAEKTMVTELVDERRRGLAFGWFNFAIGITALPSSLVFGFLYERFGALTAFAWGAALALVAALMLLALKTSLPRRED